MAVKCEACGHDFYESMMRDCPKKPGHWICLYCCGKCKRRYRGYGGGIFGCVAWDEKKAQEMSDKKK